MSCVGIICEYNPFHLGHQRQIAQIRRDFGPDTAIVCAMSGNFVQRGAPAIVDKSIRAKAAILCGADLVLELPVTVSLSSAEGFAAGGVKLLSPVCDSLCFGTESGDAASLMDTASALLSADFPPLLKAELATGKSFPAARQAALTRLGHPADLLSRPNDLLAVEYCKAILSTGSSLRPHPIRRPGSYHASFPDPENPSATSVRRRMVAGEEVFPFLPAPARPVFADAPLHTLEAGERAILSRLRSMTDADFEALPYGSEGLWRKLMHASRQESSLEAVIAATKSRRYTRTRIDRMVMCAFLGISRQMLDAPVPYARVLAFDHRGRDILRSVKKTGFFPNAGQPLSHPHWMLERHCGDLYGLFALDAPEPPGREEKRRVFYHPAESCL